MGRQAFPIIGGIIGAVVAGVFSDGSATAQGYEAGFAIGAAIGGIAGSYIDPLVIQGTRVGDTQLQVAAEGGARAIMFGRACVTATCIVARGNRKVVNKKTSNGKGSSGSTSNQTVTWTFAIGLGEAIQGSSVCRIWQDENLVYDVLGDGSISDDDNTAYAAKFKFYDGKETQLPDPDLQVFLGDDTPYFRGTAYVVFPNFDLTATAERIPVFKFEILNGVAGIVDQLETLAWSIPNASDAHFSEQSVTLTGSAGVTWAMSLFFTGEMESRDYLNVTAYLGGGVTRPAHGRFVEASDDQAHIYTTYNIYKITISDPPQTYYMNNFLPDESAPTLIEMDGSDLWKLNIHVAGNATVTYSADPVNGSSAFGPQEGSARCEITGINAGTGGTILLNSVIQSLMERAGMTDDQFDLTAIDDIGVAGVCIQDTVNGTDAINACLAPYFVDPCEVDGVLKLVKRGGDVLRTLTIDDLTEEPEIASRENVIEYPAKLHFYYQSPLTGYAMTKATSYRYSAQADSSGEGSVTAPITYYSSDEPAQIAQKLHKVMWTEADGSFTWVVGTHCLDLVPTDVVGLFLRGIATRVRITAIENDGTTLTLTMLKDRQSSYTSNVTSIPLPTPTPPLQTTMSKTALGILDIPALQDTDDQLCYYAVMSGETKVWNGGQLQRSLDMGASWNGIDEITTAVTMGLLTVGMTSATREYTDTTNTVTVQLFDSDNDLVAFSDTTFLQEQGAIAVQLTDGTWEVMQYRDAVDGGAGLWTLSYLQRGRVNTVAGAHSVGALFALLDSEVLKVPAQSAWLGGTLEHRGVSYNTSSEDATIVTTTYAGESQIEWAPVSAQAEYDGTFVYIHDIVPRHRFGTEVAPLASANFIGYRVILTGTGGTLTVDIPTGNSAHIAASPITTVTDVHVAGLNKITGAGATFNIGTPGAADAGSLAPVAIINGGGGS